MNDPFWLWLAALTVVLLYCTHRIYPFDRDS